MISAREINDLTAEERITLMEMIWKSFDENDLENLPLSDEQQRELDRRIENYEHGKTKTYSWEEVKKNLTLQ